MSRLSARILIWKHRALYWCSKAYCDLDAIMNDREKWRREAVMTAASLDARISEVANLHGRLKSALEAQESATSQLLSERALRQAAQEQANRYHDELVESLKSAANWSTKSFNRRPMFGGMADVDAEPEAPAAKPNQVPSKRMARVVAQEVTDATLKELLADIRAGRIHEEPQVGPEFSTQ